MKVAVVGGGSTYTPELVSGLSRERNRIEIDELVLHDIDPERREVVGAMAARMLDRPPQHGGDPRGSRNHRSVPGFSGVVTASSLPTLRASSSALAASRIRRANEGCCPALAPATEPNSRGRITRPSTVMSPL